MANLLQTTQSTHSEEITHSANYVSTSHYEISKSRLVVHQTVLNEVSAESYGSNTNGLPTNFENSRRLTRDDTNLCCRQSFLAWLAGCQFIDSKAGGLEQAAKHSERGGAAKSPRSLKARNDGSRELDSRQAWRLIAANPSPTA
jgi:hypothetical protein